MKIAIDESGDTGRKLWRGSSKWFILAAAIVPDSIEGCGLTCQCVSKYRQEFNYGNELHFSKNTHDQHLHFLQFMHDKDFVFAAVAIDKRKLLVKKPYILRSKTALLQYSFDALFSELKPWLDDPIVLIDASGPDSFNRALSRHLLKLFGSRHKGDFHSIKRVACVDSRDEPLVQLADYVAGAVRHHVDIDNKSSAFELYLSDKGRIFFC